MTTAVEDLTEQGIDLCNGQEIRDFICKHKLLDPSLIDSVLIIYSDKYTNVL
jgi:hypothetical protein